MYYSTICSEYIKKSKTSEEKKSEGVNNNPETNEDVHDGSKKQDKTIQEKVYPFW